MDEVRADNLAPAVSDGDAAPVVKNDRESTQDIDFEHVASPGDFTGIHSNPSADCASEKTVLMKSLAEMYPRQNVQQNIYVFPVRNAQANVANLRLQQPACVLLVGYPHS